MIAAAVNIFALIMVNPLGGVLERRQWTDVPLVGGHILVSSGLSDRSEKDLDLALQAFRLLVQIAREAEHAVGDPSRLGHRLGNTADRRQNLARSGRGALNI